MRSKALFPDVFCIDLLVMALGLYITAECQLIARILVLYYYLVIRIATQECMSSTSSSK